MGDPPSGDQEMIVVGRVGRAHGVRGEVLLDVRTDSPDERFTPGGVLATDPAAAGPLTVERARWHSGRLLVKFAEVVDRDTAEALRGTWLVIPPSALARSPDPDEFHDHELIGLRVHTTEGAEIGRVEQVRHLGQDLLVVRGRDGAELLIPFVGPLVPEVDLVAGRVVVDPPAGLLDL